jgi:deoxyribodipyrimidine photo-lyase
VSQQSKGLLIASQRNFHHLYVQEGINLAFPRLHSQFFSSGTMPGDRKRKAVKNKKDKTDDSDALDASSTDAPKSSASSPPKKARSGADAPKNTSSPAPTGKSTSKDDGLTFVERINRSRTDVCASVDGFKFNKKRVRVLSKAEDFADGSQGVVYWMSRDQRVQGKA